MTCVTKMKNIIIIFILKKSMNSVYMVNCYPNILDYLNIMNSNFLLKNAANTMFSNCNIAAF